MAQTMVPLQVSMAAALLAAAALAQVDPPAKDPAEDPAKDPAVAAAPDPALEERLKQFKAAIEDRKQGRDQEATGLIDGFTKGYEAMVPKDRTSVRKALEDCLMSSRVKREPEHKGIFVAAAYALGQMGSDGAKLLVRAYGSEKFKPDREWLELRAVLLKNVGKTKDLAHVKFLIDRALDDPEDSIMRAAGEALGYYQDSDQRVRKEITKELVKKFNEVYNESLQSLDPGDPIVERAKATLAAISRDWNETLRKLTGQDLSSPPDWLRFYNKSKDKDWSKL